MKMKRLSAIIMSTLVLTAALAGCKKDDTTKPVEDSGEKAPVEKKLEGEIVYATNRTDIADTKLKALADEFMKNNPGTKVTFEPIKDYDQVLSTRIAGGEAPDIYMWIATNTPNNVSQYFLPLDDLGFSKDSLYFYDNGKGTDGKVYGLTDSVSYSGIIYNKQAFAAAGVTEVPRTMTAFLDACEKLKAKGITPIGTAFKDSWPLYPYITESIIAGIEFGDVSKKLAYAESDTRLDETALKYLNFARTFKDKGYFEKDLMSAGWDQYKQDIAQGKTAMTWMETWLPDQFIELGAKKEDIGMFPFPDSKALVIGQGKNWGVSKDTKYPELAKAFLKYLYEDGRIALAGGAIPSNKGIQVPDKAYFTELTSFGLPIIEDIAMPANYGDIKNESELDFNAVVQTYIAAENDEAAKKYADEVNKKWATARAKVSK